MRFMEENAAAADIVLSAEVCRRLEQLINPATVAGARYNAEFVRTLDSEQEK
jgi:hypothetical protein